MTNPARQLHEAFAEWRELVKLGNKPLRSVIDPTSRKGSAQVLKVARLLVRVEDVLIDFERQGVRVELYRRQLPDWVTGMVSYQVGWTSNIAPDHVLSAEVMDEIEGLANFLDGKVYVLGSEAETLQSLLDRAQGLLAEDVELDAQLADYIHRLLQLIRRALEDEAFGLSFDYGDAVQRLWVAFRAAEGASPDRGSKWHELWVQISAGTVSGALVEGGRIIIQAITTGGSGM